MLQLDPTPHARIALNFRQLTDSLYVQDCAVRYRSIPIREFLLKEVAITRWFR
jgi:hypothetical protein